MKHYEIRELKHPDPVFGFKSMVIDEGELGDRLRHIIGMELGGMGIEAITSKAINILLHGKLKPATDPWEEWADEFIEATSWARYPEYAKKVKAALLKLRDLVERKEE